MIPFLKPYFDEDEKRLFKSHRAFQDDTDTAIESIRQKLNQSNFIITKSGEEAILMAIRHAKKQHRWKNPVIAIPSVCCASIYRPAKKEGIVILMDAGKDWNCVYDEHAQKADIVLFASLGGLRIELPKKRKGQVFIDDAAQCFDGICGLRPEADYGIFSFGNGKQMFAKGGGILCSMYHTFGGNINFGQLPNWQIVLMASQLEKLEEIYSKSISIGKSYIKYLRIFPWLRLPPQNSCFSKLVIFINQSNIQPPKKIPGRTEEIWRFIKYMAQHNIQVEETYIPLHIRFPKELNDPRYQKFQANHQWLEAITLPCRPNMTTAEVQQVLDTVRSFHPISITNKNRQVYEHRYKPFQKPQEGFFRSLYDSRLKNIRFLGNDKACIDLGCGNGLYMIPLLKHGINVTGIDFTNSMLTSIQNHCDTPTTLVNGNIQNMPFPDKSFDMAYSIATLYYVSDTEKAINEIYRILKPGGVAYLEFGNQNSLNHFEAKRVSTGAISVHVNIDWLYSYLEKVGFTIFDTEKFQAFPLYGNMISKSIKSSLATQVTHNNHTYMLDEWICNTPFLSRYAFRYCMYISKSPCTKRPNLKQLSENVDHWLSDNRYKQRLDAICKPIDQQLSILCNMMAEDPTDALTFYVLAKLHVQTEEEHLFVSQMKTDIETYIKKKCF